MSLIDTARQALTEIPISDVLRERLSLALDEAAALERKISEFQAQAAEFKAELKIALAHEQKIKEELDRLQKEHEEDIVICHSVEFRRGKRTESKWLPFCPKCHLPLIVSRSGGDAVSCQDDNCGWLMHGHAQDVWPDEHRLNNQ